MNKSLKVHKKSKKYLKRFISKINIFNFDVQFLRCVMLRRIKHLIHLYENKILRKQSGLHDGINVNPIMGFIWSRPKSSGKSSGLRWSRASQEFLLLSKEVL